MEGFSLFDAVYQVVITLSTVGYEGVQPLDNSGRVFTMLYGPEEQIEALRAENRPAVAPASDASRAG